MNNKQLLNNGWICYYPKFISQESTTFLFKSLLKECDFKSHNIKLFGKDILIPREESFHSIDTKSYGYSGYTMETQEYTESIAFIQNMIENKTRLSFNSVLVNLYRNEKDSNGWHADNEGELGLNPIIASVSLGETRRFQLKHKTTNEKIHMNLEDGDLLIMGGELQHFWKHQIPKEKFHCKPRINLTFRYIF